MRELERRVSRSLPAAGIGSRVGRIVIGAALIGFGIMAFTWTSRFAPWSLWHSAWPLAVLAAGALLLFFGGRNTMVVGLVLIGLGAIFLIGTIGMLTWALMSVLWPLVLILVGLTIIGGALSRGRGW